MFRKLIKKIGGGKEGIVYAAFLLTLLSIALFSMNAGSSYTVDENTTALWHLDENTGSVVRDETGRYNGSIDGAAWVSGKFNSGLSLDGVDDYVDLMDVRLPDNGTFEFWYKTNKTGTQVLFDKGDWDGSGGEFHILGNSGAYEARLMDSGGGTYYVSAGTLPTDGLWHHVALTWGSLGMKFYVDRVLQDTNTNWNSAKTPKDSTQTIWIGNAHGRSYFANITVDEIRILNIQKTQFECYCSGCSDCEQKLNDPSCSVVKLTADVGNQLDSCINNPANFSSKIFDCQGHTIDGDDSGNDNGIYLSGKVNNVIRNCVITDFKYGIYLYSSSNNNTLTGNTINSNIEYGILVSTSSNNNTLVNNVANSTATGDGIYLSSSSSNNLTNNTANSNYNYGIYLWSSSNNTLTSNTVNSNRYGIHLHSSSNNNVLINNTVNSNSVSGILSTSSSSTMNSNTVCWNNNLDFDSSEWLSTSGDDNTCNNPDGWNDAGTTGCTYSCECTCSGCSDCTRKLDNLSCSTVKLTADVVNQAGTCINNPSNFKNKAFDCQGHVIDGSGTGDGIKIESKNGNTIRNCVIKDFGHAGIMLNSAHNNSITNNTVRNNSPTGIWLASSNNNTIQNNTVVQNSGYSGIHVDTSNNNTLKNNNVSNNSADGIHLHDSDGNNLTNNTADYNDKSGFYFTSTSSGNTANNNRLCYNNQSGGSYYDIFNESSNAGNDNTCNITYNWNDAGASGCKHKCSEQLSDTTPPAVTLISPENNTLDTDGNTTFEYNVTDTHSGISNCSLLINGTLNQTNNTITEDATQSFTVTLPAGDYIWNVNCTDNSSNHNTGAGKERKLIVDRPPQVASASITPTTPQTTDDLTCENGTVSDADGNTVTLYYRWYKNDTLQTELTTKTIGSGNTSDGEHWKCGIIPNDGIINGTEVKSQEVIVGSGNNAPVIQNATSDSNTTHPKNVGDNITFTVTWNDTEGNQTRLFVCNTTYASTTGCTSKTLCNDTTPSTTSPKSCQYTAQQADSTTNTAYAFVCDTLSCSSYYGVIYKVNHAPTTTKPYITPTPAYTNNTLTCNIGNFSDQDGDAEGTHTWKWYKNSLQITNATTNTLGRGNHSKHDNITCEQTPKDQHGFAGAPENSTTITISNTPPKLSFIGNQSAVENTLFTLNVNATDLDNDTLTYSDNTTLFNINSTTGLIEFTPKAKDVGVHQINISVTDGEDSDYEIIYFNITSDPDANPPEVTLNRPYDESTDNDGNVTFVYTPRDVSPIANCTLYGNFTGTWKANQTNHTITNNTQNNFKLLLPDGLYKWNVECVDNKSHSGFAAYNWTIKVEITTPTVTATRNLPTMVTAGTSFNATLNVDVNELKSPSGYSIIEHVPAAWNVTYSHPNYDNYNPATGRLEWMFYGTEVKDRAITYAIQTPANAGGTVGEFNGTAETIEGQVKITGDTEVLVGGTYNPVTVTRILPEEVSVWDTFTVELNVNVNKSSNLTGVIITEHVPDGWNVANITPSSMIHDQAKDQIKWLFYGSGLINRTIRYTIQVPHNASGTTGVFDGRVIVEGSINPIVGETNTPVSGVQTLQLSTPPIGYVGQPIQTIITDGLNPVKDALVTFTLSGQVHPGLTDTQGKITFRPHITGTLTIDATKGGYFSSETVEVNITSEAILDLINFTTDKTNYNTGEPVSYNITVSNQGAGATVKLGVGGMRGDGYPFVYVSSLQYIQNGLKEINLAQITTVSGMEGAYNLFAIMWDLNDTLLEYAGPVSMTIGLNSTPSGRRELTIPEVLVQQNIGKQVRITNPPKAVVNTSFIASITNGSDIVNNAFVWFTLDNKISPGLSDAGGKIAFKPSTNGSLIINALKLGYLDANEKEVKAIWGITSHNKINATANETTNVTSNQTGVSLKLKTNDSVSNADLNITYTTESQLNASLSVPGLGKYLKIDSSQELSSNLDHVMIEIKYTDEELNVSGLNESSLRIYHYNESMVPPWYPLSGSMDWVYGTGVNETENYVWANVSHFSDYTVGGTRLLEEVEVLLSGGWNLFSLPLSSA